jgi:hypothetical protein
MSCTRGCYVKKRYFLFKSFAMNMYGFQFWDMSDRCIENFHIAWRKCVRSIMELPYRTHNHLIPTTIDISIQTQLEKRTMKYLEKMSNSMNKYLRLYKDHIIEGSMSHLSRNLLHVCNKYRLQETNINCMNYSNSIGMNVNHEHEQTAPNKYKGGRSFSQPTKVDFTEAC